LFSFQSLSASAAEPVVTVSGVEWYEQSCGGSNIRVTRVDGKIVAVDAYAERSFDRKEWQCHYVDGRVNSVLYTHYKLNRKWAEEGGPYAQKFQCDRVLVFPIKDHKLDNVPKELRDDLIDVLTRVQKSK